MPKAKVNFKAVKSKFFTLSLNWKTPFIFGSHEATGNPKKRKAATFKGLILLHIIFKVAYFLNVFKFCPK
jgi:hypothetical protein